MNFWHGLLIGVFAPGVLLSLAAWLAGRFLAAHLQAAINRWADRRDMIWTEELGDGQCPECDGWRAIGHRAGCSVALGLRAAEASLGERKVQG